jgi:class 3 adenylate cyclase
MYVKRRSLTLTDKQSVIHGEKLDVVVVYADLRGFSQWSMAANAPHIMRVIEVVYDRVIQLAFFYRHAFHKFLGDGFLLLWESADHGSRAEALHWALEASLEIHKRYWFMTKQLGFPSPLGFGIGISCGEVVKIDPQTFVPELNEPDFAGYPMSSGARLQSLAGPYGTVIDHAAAAEAEREPTRVLRSENEILRLSLLDPNDKSRAIAGKLTGLQSADMRGFRYVVWPYAKDALWRVDGMP